MASGPNVLFAMRLRSIWPSMQRRNRLIEMRRFHGTWKLSSATCRLIESTAIVSRAIAERTVTFPSANAIRRLHSLAASFGWLRRSGASLGLTILGWSERQSYFSRADAGHVSPTLSMTQNSYCYSANCRRTQQKWRHSQSTREFATGNCVSSSGLGNVVYRYPVRHIACGVPLCCRPRS